MIELRTLKIPLRHIVGTAASHLLEQHFSLLPEKMSVTLLDDGFIARPGPNEYLISNTQPFSSQLDDAWVFDRADTLLSLSGGSWQKAMTHICHMDMSAVLEGDWLVVTGAGINLWCIGQDNGLLIGCDPSLGNYFTHTLKEIVDELNSIENTEKRNTP
ncbi:MAG: hypothetical protein ACWA44_08230 [Thiotrichales bacterium]